MLVGKPFLTWYGDGRVELSYATFGNWVAKTANLLRDGWDVQPGDAVGVDLPPHWQSVAVAFGVRLAGAVAGGDGEVRFVWRDGIVVEPGGADYATEVLAYGDAFPGTLDPVPGGIEADERVLLREPSYDRLVEVALACHAAGASLVVGPADPTAERVTRVLD